LLCGDANLVINNMKTIRLRKLSAKLLVATISLLSLLVVFTSESKTETPIHLGHPGETRYSIYLEPSAPLSVKNAANELKKYLFKVGKFSVPIVVSASPPQTPFISLGDNVAAKSSGLNINGISNDGFRIVTVNQNLFILGKDTLTGKLEPSGGIANGTANGIYTFIEEYLGVHWLTPSDIGEEFTEVNNIELSPINRVVSPPFGYRMLPHIGDNSQVKLWEKRSKLGASMTIEHTHAWIRTIPPTLFETHPEWFPQIRGKRITPRGISYKLETTNPELVRAYADGVIKAFRDNPNRRSYSLSPSDGNYGWSQSNESVALHEKAPDGSISRTKLILKFYNDVAKIVKREFPDRKLGGYIYLGYLYPPKDGIPKLESNISLVFASAISYGFRLYRPDVRTQWSGLVKAWGESAKRDDRDLYYYDLPTLMNTAWTKYTALVPSSPDILNFIFPRLLQNGFKGVYFYGNKDWAGSGAANYVTSKLLWNPSQDANILLKNYFTLSYGSRAAIHIGKFDAILGATYRKFYISNPNANFIFKPNYYKEIYAPIYSELEDLYQKAYRENKTAKQQMRLELLGLELAKMKIDIDANQ
jgi:hypothetical protein